MPSVTTTLATLVDPGEVSRIDAVSDSGFSLHFDTRSVDEDGAGASPTETVLAALAACTGMDVASIMRKKRQTMERYQIAVTGEKADEHPQVFTAIVVEHQVVGDVSAEAVRRSVELSATTYCPVSAMLSKSVQIEHRYRLQRSEGAAVDSTLVVVTGPAAA